DSKEFLGKHYVVMIFYPGNNTPVCTAQLCSIRDSWGQFEKVGAKVFGINQAKSSSTASFAEKHDFPFPLLVDNSGELTRNFGCRTWFGFIKRTVYVIDKEGKIIFAERGKPSNSVILQAIEGEKTG